MMNIKEYFEKMALEIGYDKMLEKENEIYTMYDEDFESFEEFCKNENIDLTATQTIGIGRTESVLVLWGMEYV